MIPSFPLAEAFLAHAHARGAGPVDAATLEGLLLRAWETGRRAWPQVTLAADVFVRHLAEQLSTADARTPLARLLEQVALAGLYLACACVQHAPGAVELLEHHFLEKLPASLGYLKLPAARLDELCQQVRIHLLIGTNGTGPRLAEYTGRGSLASWIRVIAVRMAFKQGALVREIPEEDALDALAAMPAPGPDPEIDLIKQRYQREFRQAVREAFATLSSEQRHLLRLHFIDRLSTSEMGPLFRVNQSTISRWLKSARQVVYEETKRRLRQALGLSSQEFASLLGAIDSQLDVSLSQVFGEER